MARVFQLWKNTIFIEKKTKVCAKSNCFSFTENGPETGPETDLKPDLKVDLG